MLGQHWDEHEHDHDHDQFQTTFLPINPKNYEHDSFSGELRYSSSECSSYVGSPNSINGTTYGAQSPTISYARELFNISDHFQGVQHNDVQCPNSIIESMNRATPYSPDEKKERIERYRSKRNLRNFTKKIKYECRKTLADSRPRVRGRFARNEEIDKAAAPQTESWDHHYITEDDDINDDYNWIGILDAMSNNFMP
ncbi:hypothetical protein ACS0TY_014978 [Phlomoides rotata]